MSSVPSYEDVTSAFDRIRADACVAGDTWCQRHPLGDFIRVSDRIGSVARDCERLAAYRLLPEPAPAGYYDDTIEKLEAAIALLQQQRAIDHGDLPRTRRDGSGT